ncbi:hypothetical protein acdb102_43570 [Acidothermaceae bacterium B102]|nr:hypothetical protein acdb102_43570 [Acidothermaceae bacterium B102]
MDKTKQTLAIALVAVLVVLAGGWFLLVSPQRANVSTLNNERTAQDSTNAGLQQKIQALKAELVELPAAKAQLEAVARRLPPDLAEVSLIQSLTKAAAQANVDLQIITPGAPAAAAVAPVQTLAPTATATTTTSAAAGAAAAPVAAAPVSAGTLYAVPLGLTVSGDYFDIEMFVHNLEGMQRALLVSNITIAKGASAVTPGAAAATNTASTGTSTAKSGTTTKSAAKGKTTTGKTTAGKSTAVKAVPPVPGSAAAAQKEALAVIPFVPNTNTLSVTIAATVFSLYTTTPQAAAVPTAATTSAPTK